MWVLMHYVMETFSNASKTHMWSGNHLSSFNASVRNKYHNSCKLRRSYPKGGEVIDKTYATDQAIAWSDAEILRYIKPHNIGA